MNTAIFNALSHPLSELIPWYLLLMVGIAISVVGVFYNSLHLPSKQAMGTVVRKEEQKAHWETGFIPLVNGASVTMVPEPYQEPAHYKLHLQWDDHRAVYEVPKEMYSSIHEGDTLKLTYVQTRITNHMEIIAHDNAHSS